MNIGIIGIGFVGSATAEVLKTYHNLYYYDKFKEPYNKLENLKELVDKSEIVLICVPTPMQKNGAIDYTNINDSLDELLSYVRNVKRNTEEILVIIRSTAIPGTIELLSNKYPFRFAFNPEFLREKHALEDMKKTDRIVIGAGDEKSLKQAEEMYKPIFPNAKYVLTDPKTAEMIKYSANVTLASQIAIANELYKICETLGIDYQKVKDAILLDKRIGTNINVPGPDGDFGFGGKCFAKDLNALIYLSKKSEYEPLLLEEVWKLNERVRKNKDWLNIDGATSERNFK